MKFKQFLNEEDTGTNGLTIYNPRVYMPKKGPDGKTWREEAKYFYEKLPENLEYREHGGERALERLGNVKLTKSDLGDENTFINNIYEFKYDNGKLVGVSVNLYNLEKIEKFKDIVKPKHRYPISITNTPVLYKKGPEVIWNDKLGKLIETGKSTMHEYRDLKNYATVGRIITVMTPILAYDEKGNRKPITPTSKYATDDSRGRVAKIKPIKR